MTAAIRFSNHSRTYGQFTDAQILHAVRLWRLGKDTHDIANVFGFGEDYVYNHMAEWRLRMRNVK